MHCLFCFQIEPHSEDAREYVCSTCTQLFLAQAQEKLKAAYQLALDKGMVNKARGIQIFIGEEENVPETNEIRKRLLGERPVRSLKPAGKRNIRA